MWVIAKCRHCQQLGPRLAGSCPLPRSDMADGARCDSFHRDNLNTVHQPSSFKTDCWLWLAWAKIAVAACWMICERANSAEALA